LRHDVLLAARVAGTRFARQEGNSAQAFRELGCLRIVSIELPQLAE
jgi:hypothetical protein